MRFPSKQRLPHLAAKATFTGQVFGHAEIHVFYQFFEKIGELLTAKTYTVKSGKSSLDLKMKVLTNTTESFI